MMKMWYTKNGLSIIVSFVIIMFQIDIKGTAASGQLIKEDCFA